MEYEIFTDANLYLKQIRLDDLNKIEESAMKIAFAGFSDENRPSTEEVNEYLEDMHAITGLNHSFDPASYRRYAGDTTLPKNRYYTIASNESGDDNGTLVRELRTYYNPRNAGILQIFDSTLPEDRIALSRVILAKLSPSLYINFLPLADKPNKFAAKSTYFPTDFPTKCIVNFPLRVESRKVEKVVDLRNPVIATNFTKALSRLHWNDKSSAFPARPELSGFEELLPSLFEQSLGGAGTNNIIGIWLRKIGANGLIFPSARVNPSVKVLSGVLQEASGWNYVDYEGASATDLNCLIHLDNSWPLNIRHTPEGPGKPYFYPIPSARIYFTREGPESGSWYVSGLREAREALWRFTMALECLDGYSDKIEELKPIYEWLFYMYSKVYPRHHVSENAPPEQSPHIATHNLEALGSNSAALQEAILGVQYKRDKILEFANNIQNHLPELGKALKLLLKLLHDNNTIQTRFVC